MPMIKAFKMDGLGNKFVIVDRRKDLVDISKEKIIHLGNLKSFHRDIEFDQIIFIEKEVDKAFPITIFNSDGSEVSACGNGSRCVAYFLYKENNKKEIVLWTSSGILKSIILENNLVETEIGIPKTNWDEIPLSKNLNTKNLDIRIANKNNNEHIQHEIIILGGNAVNVGNPHIIFFVDNNLIFCA